VNFTTPACFSLRHANLHLCFDISRGTMYHFTVTPLSFYLSPSSLLSFRSLDISMLQFLFVKIFFFFALCLSSWLFSSCLSDYLHFLFDFLILCCLKILFSFSGSAAFSFLHICLLSTPASQLFLFHVSCFDSNVFIFTYKIINVQICNNYLFFPISFLNTY
jgi:hypothetical protein